MNVLYLASFFYIVSSHCPGKSPTNNAGRYSTGDMAFTVSHTPKLQVAPYDFTVLDNTWRKFTYEDVSNFAGSLLVELDEIAYYVDNGGVSAHASHTDITAKHLQVTHTDDVTYHYCTFRNNAMHIYDAMAGNWSNPAKTMTVRFPKNTWARENPQTRKYFKVTGTRDCLLRAKPAPASSVAYEMKCEMDGITGGCRKWWDTLHTQKEWKVYTGHHTWWWVDLDVKTVLMNTTNITFCTSCKKGSYSQWPPDTTAGAADAHCSYTNSYPLQPQGGPVWTLQPPTEYKSEIKQQPLLTNSTVNSTANPSHLYGQQDAPILDEFGRSTTDELYVVWYDFQQLDSTGKWPTGNALPTTTMFYKVKLYLDGILLDEVDEYVNHGQPRTSEYTSSNTGLLQNAKGLFFERRPYVIEEVDPPSGQKGKHLPDMKYVVINLKSSNLTFLPGQRLDVEIVAVSNAQVESSIHNTSLTLLCSMDTCSLEKQCIGNTVTCTMVETSLTATPPKNCLCMYCDADVDPLVWSVDQLCLQKQNETGKGRSGSNIQHSDTHPTATQIATGGAVVVSSLLGGAASSISGAFNTIALAGLCDKSGGTLATTLRPLLFIHFVPHEEPDADHINFLCAFLVLFGAFNFIHIGLLGAIKVIKKRTFRESSAMVFFPNINYVWIELMLPGLSVSSLHLLINQHKFRLGFGILGGTILVGLAATLIYMSMVVVKLVRIDKTLFKVPVNVTPIAMLPLAPAYCTSFPHKKLQILLPPDYWVSPSKPWKIDQHSRLVSNYTQKRFGWLYSPAALSLLFFQCVITYLLAVKDDCGDAKLNLLICAALRWIIHLVWAPLCSIPINGLADVLHGIVTFELVFIYMDKVNHTSYVQALHICFLVVMLLYCLLALVGAIRESLMWRNHKRIEEWWYGLASTPTDLSSFIDDDAMQFFDPVFWDTYFGDGLGSYEYSDEYGGWANYEDYGDSDYSHSTHTASTLTSDSELTDTWSD